MTPQKGQAIYWDLARSILYFSEVDSNLTYDEEEGVFRNSQGQFISTDEINTATIRDQNLLDEMIQSHADRGSIGLFIPFEGFNEEVEYQLIEWE